MKRYLVVFLFFAIVALPGCGTLDQQFVKAVDDSWQVMGPEYAAYVQNDPNLDAGTKKIRANSAKSLSELIAAAKASGK